MNRREHLYVILAEEAAEVIQAVCKILRFSEMSHHPDDPSCTPNVKRLVQEFSQMIAVIDMLSDERYPDLLEDEIDSMIQAKKDNVIKYFDASREYGRLD